MVHMMQGGAMVLADNGVMAYVSAVNGVMVFQDGALHAGRCYGLSG
jgi:hypothetical protein